MTRGNVIIIGGGFYGCAIALHLKPYFERVTILEKSRELMTRASYVNQARVHAGYHYPRSLQTAASSAQNLKLFSKLYKDCIDDAYTCLYAIAAQGSKINQQYFSRFCRQLSLPLKPAAKDYSRLFSDRFISGVYECQEYAFDAAALRARFTEELARAGVEVRLGATARAFEPNGAETVAVKIEQSDETQEACAAWVFNTTYANLNAVGGISDRDTIGLRHQVTEMCLVRVPSILENVGVTVMDGPFFSIMPFPAKKLHSLSHVRYTPHFTWHEASGAGAPPDEILADHAKGTRFEWMARDARRFLPVMDDVVYQESLFDIKTTLTETLVDDARPIAIRTDRGCDRFVSILGGKIDNIFDVLRVLEKRLGIDE